MTWLKHCCSSFTRDFFSVLISAVFPRQEQIAAMYWLFDQAWESAQLWKDKLAASCWPIATNQSHLRKRLIVSMPCSPQQSHQGLRRRKNCGVVFNKKRRSGLWDVSCAPTHGPIRSHVLTDGLEWTQSDTGGAGPTSSAVTMTTLDWFGTWESG